MWKVGRIYSVLQQKQTNSSIAHTPRATNYH